MSIEGAFNRVSNRYDRWVRNAIPCYDELFSTAIELIPFPDGAPLRVLDLGAGTGLLAERVLRRYAEAHFVLYDVSPEMLEIAKTRFRRLAERFEFRLEDFLRISGEACFELVISSLAIHHLSDPDKRTLFGLIHRALIPGGVFINVDQIKAPTEPLRRLYWDSWLERVRATDAEEPEIQEAIQRRTRHDQDASLPDQLSWMAQAGFSDVDCIYKIYFLGVLIGTKPAAPDPT